MGLKPVLLFYPNYNGYWFIAGLNPVVLFYPPKLKFIKIEMGEELKDKIYLHTAINSIKMLFNVSL